MTVCESLRPSKADVPRYTPIAEHGLIGDMRTAALVGTNGTIDWYCCTRFDAPSVFAAILDADRGGAFELAPDVPARTKQFYFPDTNILITRLGALAGWARCKRSSRGFDYVRQHHEVRQHPRGAIFQPPALLPSPPAFPK